MHHLWAACGRIIVDRFLVTGPVARLARQIAGHGYIVAAPSSYHEFTSYEPLAYDGPGTDAGNEYKVKKVRPSPLRTILVVSMSGLISGWICRSYTPTTKMLLSP